MERLLARHGWRLLGPGDLLVAGRGGSKASSSTQATNRACGGVMGSGSRQRWGRGLGVPEFLGFWFLRFLVPGVSGFWGSGSWVRVPGFGGFLGFGGFWERRLGVT